MKILKEGDKGRKSTKFDGSDVVECHHTSVHPSLPKGARFQLCWNVDLSKLTDAQRAEAMAEYFIIKIRRAFANVEKPKDGEWDNVDFDAADFVTQRHDPIAKMQKELARFTDEELAAMGLKRS